MEIEPWEAFIRSMTLHTLIRTYEPWLWPLCETLHYLGLSLLLGTVGLFDLRVLGFGAGHSVPGHSSPHPVGNRRLPAECADRHRIFFWTPRSVFLQQRIPLQGAVHGNRGAQRGRLLRNICLPRASNVERRHGSAHAGQDHCRHIAGHVGQRVNLRPTFDLLSPSVFSLGVGWAVLRRSSSASVAHAPCWSSVTRACLASNTTDSMVKRLIASRSSCGQ